MQNLLVEAETHVFFNPAFRGLGLPHYAWSTFSNLMEVVTKGQFDCSTDMQDGVEYGFCISYTGCASFTNVWKYAFQVYFNGGDNTNYINIPLSTFAFDYIDDSGAQYCQIYAEYLDPYQPQSSNVIMGAMFFQSFVGIFTVDPNGNTPVPNLQLYVQQNTYVLPGVYIGDEQPPLTAVNPFAVQPVTPPIVPSPTNLLPTILIKTSATSF